MFLGYNILCATMHSKMYEIDFWEYNIMYIILNMAKNSNKRNKPIIGINLTIQLCRICTLFSSYKQKH